MARSEYTTSSRTKILTYLEDNKNRAVNVNDIAVYLKEKNHTVNVTTIYRYLDKLEKEGLVLKYVAEKGTMASFQLVEQGKNCHEHLHLKCVKCGGVSHLECGFMQDISEHVLKDHGFLLQCENSVLYGVCKNCVQNKKRVIEHIRYENVDGHNKDFVSLCHNLDDYLNDIVGGEQNRAAYIPYNCLDDINDAIVAYEGDSPVGCASFKRYDSDHAEIKRVFIKKEYRGQGISKKMMEMLEDKAREQGYIYCILESGEILVNAMKLYRTIGYKVIPNYGPYVEMKDSVCMKKTL